MNIQSMTGYGAGISGGYKVEVRSTNHKSLQIQINLPSYFYHYEPEIRSLVREMFQRGYIEVLFTNLRTENVTFKVNKSLAEGYYRALVSLKKELSIPGNVGIDILAQQREIFYLENLEIEIPAFREALETALEGLMKANLGGTGR